MPKNKRRHIDHIFKQLRQQPLAELSSSQLKKLRNTVNFYLCREEPDSVMYQRLRAAQQVLTHQLHPRLPMPMLDTSVLEDLFNASQKGDDP